MTTTHHYDDNQDREDRLNYLDQYSCRPPPFFLLALSFAQVVAVIMMVVVDNNDYDSTDRGLCLPCLNPDQPRQRRRSQWSGLYEGSNTPLIYAIRPLLENVEYFLDVSLSLSI